MGLIVMSQAFKNGEPIPSMYACDGEDVSPPISWSGAPQQTRSYGLIVDDIDAPMGKFAHWMIFNIPAAESSLEERVPTLGTLSNGAIQGRNGFDKIGYAGPCPPSGTHRYVFHLYALDTLLSVQAGFVEHDVLEAMKGHVLAEGELTGLYSRR
jgi:Raf kinase inhibitor-like YbhB/YbcL family protein